MISLLSPRVTRSGAGPGPRSARRSDRRRISLLIGDGDAEFRRSLRARMENDPQIDVVGEADDGEVALQLARWLRPDVALLDADMPCFGGAAIARILASELPAVRVIVMTPPLGGGTP
ncbi:MAG TPA: response regulator transcription factor [Candidatus Limnocylindria bacterium]|nr:response regulator transcription factor [Candidatus Limnocylindria bacterium]